MRFGYISPEFENDWEQLLKDNPATGYMQSFAWTGFKNLLAWDTFKIGIFNHDKLVGGAVVSRFAYTPRRNALFISQGPVLPYDSPAQAGKMFAALMLEIDKIANFSGDILTSHLSIEPKISILPSYLHRFVKAPVDQEPIRTLLIDLSLSQDDLWHQMQPKGRYNIKVAQRHEVEITSTDLSRGWPDFYRFYKQFVNRKSIDGKNKSYFERLAYIYPTVNLAQIYWSRYRGKIQDAAIVLYYGHTATFLYGASSATNRRSMSAYLLHWQIILDAQKMGYRWYDFYGLTPRESDSSHPWHGFSIFKQKFGGVIRKYLGAYDFVYNQPLYQEYLRKNCSV